MAAIKTIVATGLSSGLGFEALKQLLAESQPYRFILGVRNTASTDEALKAVDFDRKANPVTLLPLDLTDVKGTKTFAQRVLQDLDTTGIDYLLLNAALIKNASEATPYGGKWCESMVVNHVVQHYLIHLLREKLVASHSRIAVVSSGAIRNVPDASKIEEILKDKSSAGHFDIYSASKFTQLLGAHWWRRELKGQCDVVAVSPGLIPNTGLGRYSNFKISEDMPDAKSVATGAKSIIEVLKRNDFPEDPDRIFLTSWGEWWSRDTIAMSCDKELQDKWSFSKEEIEKDAGIA